MRYRGKMRNGVVVLNNSGDIAEGAEVTVEPIGSPQATPGAPESGSVFDAWKRAKPTGMPDLAINHDHYLYGHPVE